MAAIISAALDRARRKSFNCGLYDCTCLTNPPGNGLSCLLEDSGRFNRDVELHGLSVLVFLWDRTEPETDCIMSRYA